MVELRPLLTADKAQWLALRHALWPDNALDELKDEVDAYEPGDPKATAIGAFDGDTLVAFAEASVRPWGDGCDTAPVGWLEGIYVAPAHRSAGIARRLVKAVENWTREKGLAELGSDALIDNTTSIARHGQWGFEQTKRVVMFRKRLG
ncbi:GNAT family N-acetyltransferase [Pelagibacterium xiamenense]|uniref:GNAT family N-acetyltransferase n=1 Tax=Pelagibacterium xiamenense TaxID=2901140 RepID=UPI001E522FD4|nr:GNAT family N-acetyltransferase [Pelagibacterium xiamenense]MCD7061452.1 GNAT family N-acetyltransferase [Pelagibacterium xiamenense]